VQTLIDVFADKLMTVEFGMRKLMELSGDEGSSVKNVINGLGLIDWSDI